MNIFWKELIKASHSVSKQVEWGENYFICSIIMTLFPYQLTPKMQEDLGSWYVLIIQYHRLISSKSPFLPLFFLCNISLGGRPRYGLDSHQDRHGQAKAFGVQKLIVMMNRIMYLFHWVQIKEFITCTEL